MLSVNDAAFTSLYREFIGQVIGTVNRIVRNEAVASEIAHDAFAKVIEDGIPDEADEAKRRITQIAKHRAIDQYRRDKLFDALNNEYARFVSDSDMTDTSPEKASIARENLESIAEIIQLLPDQQRKVLLLARFTKHDNATIASMLGISVANVKISLHRAMKVLEKQQK